jgi:hypothetical protein
MSCRGGLRCTRRRDWLRVGAPAPPRPWALLQGGSPPWEGGALFLFEAFLFPGSNDIRNPYLDISEAAAVGFRASESRFGHRVSTSARRISPPRPCCAVDELVRPARGEGGWFERQCGVPLASPQMSIIASRAVSLWENLGGSKCTWYVLSYYPAEQILGLDAW